MTYTRED